jgi:hypothetical protein
VDRRRYRRGGHRSFNTLAATERPTFSANPTTPATHSNFTLETYLSSSSASSAPNHTSTLSSRIKSGSTDFTRDHLSRVLGRIYAGKLPLSARPQALSSHRDCRTRTYSVQLRRDRHQPRSRPYRVLPLLPSFSTKQEVLGAPPQSTGAPPSTGTSQEVSTSFFSLQHPTTWLLSVSLLSCRARPRSRRHLLSCPILSYRERRPRSESEVLCDRQTTSSMCRNPINLAQSTTEYRLSKLPSVPLFPRWPRQAMVAAFLSRGRHGLRSQQPPSSLPTNLQYLQADRLRTMMS